MLERSEVYQDPTTQIRRSLCRQMVPEHRTPLPRPKSLSGTKHEKDVHKIDNKRVYRYKIHQQI